MRKFIKKNYILVYIILLNILSIITYEIKEYVNLEYKYNSLKQENFKNNTINWDELGKYGIVAWVKCGNIDIPVCYTKNNEKYKRSAFDGTYSLYGGAYLNEGSDICFTRNVNLIYLFSSRCETEYAKLKSQAYLNKEITLYTPNNIVHKYKIISFFLRKENEYKEFFKDETEYKLYQEEIKEKSSIKYNVKINTKKRLLFLSAFPPLAHPDEKVLTIAAIEE